MPASAIDPASAKMIALYPAPNLPGEINNFLYNPVQTNRVDQFNIRSDYRTSRSAIFGRFSYEDADTFNPGQSAGAGDRRGSGPARSGGGAQQAGGVRLRPLARSLRSITTCASDTRACFRASTTRARSTARSPSNWAF